MAEAPAFAATPLELLTNKCITRPPQYLQWYGSACLGTFMFVGVCTSNWVTRRPLFSGLQRHVLFTGIGALVGQVVDGWRNDYYAERDAVYRHYVELHPDDFPPYARKKFSEVLEPWPPIR